MAEQGLPLPKWTGLAIAGVALAAAATITMRYGLAAALILMAGGALVLFIWLAFRAVQSVTEEHDEAMLIEHAPTPAIARKAAALRALKDIETERGLGNLSDEDFQEIEARYRDEAKRAMREVDEERKALRARAEALAEKAIAKSLQAEDDPVAEPEKKIEPVACPACEAKNDPDAAFCKRCGEKLGDAA